MLSQIGPAPYGSKLSSQYFLIICESRFDFFLGDNFIYLFLQLESDLNVKACDFNTTLTMSVYITSLSIFFFHELMGC